MANNNQMWDNDRVQFSTIMKIADMSVQDWKDAYLNEWDGPFVHHDISDDDIQEIIDRAKAAKDAYEANGKTWDSAVQDAADAYAEMYDDSLKYLEMSANVTDEQWDEAYNASVSDNYATGDVSFDGEKFTNQKITGAVGDDNIKIDYSETQLMQKTQLSDGKFVRYAPSDYFDSNAKVGETRNICGGTITYLGKKSVTYDRGEFGHGGLFDVDHWAGTGAWEIPFYDGRTNIVHYEGVLGSFDYDASMFSLGYWEQTMPNGEKVDVPILHYIGDGKIENAAGFTYDGILDGAQIEIPEGIVNCDYMFADTGIKSMPEIPNSVTSAHCMFMNAKDLYKGCANAIQNTGVYQGTLKMPENLEDGSWMFAGCTQMQNCFGDMGQTLVDGRYMFAECYQLGWDGEKHEGDTMYNNFKAPNFSRLRHTSDTYLQNMFDATSVEVLQTLKDANVLSAETEWTTDGNGVHISEWVDSNGAHHNRYDSLVDGSYNPNLVNEIEKNTTRAKILELIDKESSGLTGVSSITDGLATTGVQITDNGVYEDSSLWANFLQSDFHQTFDKGNEFGEIIDRAIPAIGTYAISKHLLGNIFGDGAKGKGISTLGAIGIAAIPQVVGFGNRITPVLDWTANVLGEDTTVGHFFKNLSDKLKGNVTYSTKVEELDIDKTFNEMRETSVGYAGDQLQRSLTTVDYDEDGTADDIVATRFNMADDMRKNGQLVAQDANLLFVACEPEENLKATMSDSIMNSALASIDAKMQNELKAAGSDDAKISEIREKYSGYYITLLYNVNEYDDAAKAEIAAQYASDPELKDMAMNGLEKVMRNTATPLYDHMAALQDEWQEKYGMPFISDKQMNDKDLSTSVMEITGLGTFNDYDPDKDYTDGSDKYADKLATYQQALVNAVAASEGDQDKINQAYAAYYEAAYGWAIDEASKHGAYGVVLDQKAELTQEGRDAFAEFVAKVEAEQNGAAQETPVDSVAGAAVIEGTTESLHSESPCETAPSEEYLTSITQPDGLKFDAEYYAQQNPDVVQAFGTSDAEVMLSHYLGYGHAEGRAGYNGDAGHQELPDDYVTGDAVFDEESDYVKIHQNELAEYASGYGYMYDRVQAREGNAGTEATTSEHTETSATSSHDEAWFNAEDLPANTPDTVREYVRNGRRAAAANESSQTNNRYNQAVNDLGVQDLDDGQTLDLSNEEGIVSVTVPTTPC